MSDRVTPDQRKPYIDAVENASKFGAKLLKLKIPRRLVGLLMSAHLNIATFGHKWATDILIGTTDSQTDKPPLPDPRPQEQE